MSTYVYGFAKADHPLPLSGLIGVGKAGPPVRLVRQNGLVAVVSDAPVELRAKRRDLEAHHGVVDSLYGHGPVLPLRFGTMAPDDDAVRRELAASASRYAELLRRLDGHVEVNVKARHDEREVLADMLAGNPALAERNEALRATGGGGYQEQVAFGEQVAAVMEQRRRHDAERVVAGLRPHAADVRLAPPVDGCFVNASFLVVRAKVAEFETTASRLRDEQPTYAEVRVSGPLPPYSFVDADVANA
jgi:hypothetical protein